MPDDPSCIAGSALERLERGEVVAHAAAPFALPAGDDLAFLLAQRVAGLGRKHISHDPHTGATAGFARTGGDQAVRLGRLLGDFSRSVTAWLAAALPRYAGGLEPDRATFRPEEEATRQVRMNARNDLLHVDAFPTRPARGRRILRVYANLHPAEPRVWATADPLQVLLARYRGRMRRGPGGWLLDLEGACDLLRPADRRRTPADALMRRLHDYLKRNLRFQQKGRRRLYHFPPGSAWLAMTDACCHAELRGRFALEHSFFVAPGVLLRPELAPAALLAG
jgi:hypothetical protein